MVVWWTCHETIQTCQTYTNLAKKQHAILPNTRHKVHLDSSVVSVRATWHVHISPACIRPLATSGTFERCHGSVVDQAPTWQIGRTPCRQRDDTRGIAVRVRKMCVRLDTCTSRQHAYAHSPRLARLKGVMVVWWTKHQLGKKTTLHFPKKTP